MKKAALFEIIKVVEEEMAGPFEHLQKLIAPFQEAYKFFTEAVNNVKESWNLLVYG